MTVYARIGNLSEGGLFLRTSTPLERGSRTVVRFGESNIEATAQVVWARNNEGAEGPPGMGLMFVEAILRAQATAAPAHAEGAPMASTLGQDVLVRSEQKELRGIAEDLDEDGALLLRTPDGKLERVLAGDVEQVRSRKGG